MAIECQPGGAEAGGTGVAGGLRAGEGLREPRSTRHQPEGRCAPPP